MTTNLLDSMGNDDSRQLHVLKIAVNLSSLTIIVFKLKRNYSNRYIQHICSTLCIFRVSKCSYNYDLNKQCARLQPAGSYRARHVPKLIKKNTYCQMLDVTHLDSAVFRGYRWGKECYKSGAGGVGREVFSLKVCASFHFLGGVYCTLQQHGVRETGRRANAMQHYTELPSNLNKPCTPAVWKCTPRTAWHR